MDKVFLICSLLLCFVGCSVDRLAILIRQYNSGVLVTEKSEEIERKFASAKEQYASNKSKKLLILYIEGMTYEKRKNYAAALSAFNRIIDSNDSILDVWLHVAKIYSLLNQKVEARKAYFTCIEIINKEIVFIEKNQWPNNHILLDDHVKYALRYSMVDNSYLPLEQARENKGNMDYKKIKVNLLRLKKDIEKFLLEN